MAHPNSLANLKSWDKGVSGNPKGGMTIRGEIRALQAEAKIEVMEAIVTQSERIICLKRF
jgi:hypothetical protein